jgi:alpha-L-fucosidase
VKVDCAYFAIALALRHNTAIVVRSDLLHDDELSYTTDEIRSYYPKMVEITSSSFIPKIDSRGTEYVRHLMVKRYYEAIRQGNEEKIRQFEPYVNNNNNNNNVGGGDVSNSNGSNSSNSSSNSNVSVVVSGVNNIVGQDSNVTNASI